MHVTESENYWKSGYSNLGPVITASVCKSLKRAISEWLGPSPITNQYGILRNNCWREISLLQSQLEPLAHLALQLLGVSSISLFQDNLIWKPPSGQQAISWHQDYSYWPLSGPYGVTFWIPLDDTDIDNGCVHVIPESHTLGAFAATNFIESGTAPWGIEQTAFEIHKHTAHAQALPMQSGHCLAFHPLLWHMSPANGSTRDRCAWSLTWITNQVRWDPDHAPHPFTHWLQPQKNDIIEGELFPRFRR